MRTLLRSPNRLIALALGVGIGAYGVLSLLGGRVLVGILFLAACALLALGAALGIAAARVVNITVGAVWVVVGYVGLFLIGSTANVLDLIAPDEVVFFGAATVHLAVGLGARRDGAAGD